MNFEICGQEADFDVGKLGDICLVERQEAKVVGAKRPSLPTSRSNVRCVVVVCFTRAQCIYVLLIEMLLFVINTSSGPQCSSMCIDFEMIS